MIGEAALGPVTGIGTFVLLTGGRFPRVWPRPPGRARPGRWLTISACAALEEIAWRGIVLAGLLPVIGPWPALGVSSIAFAIWHWSSLRAGCLVHLVTGLAFGGVYLAGGIAAAVLAHASYNVLVDWAVHAERVRMRDP